MIENKRCRHPMASGHFYKGNCEDCVIERWEACDALLEIRDRQIEDLSKYVRHYPYKCMRFDSSGDAYSCSCGLDELLSEIKLKEPSDGR